MHVADDGHTLSVKQEELCSQNQWDFSNLNALLLNCTLKPTPELSHTEGLTRIAITIMEKTGSGRSRFDRWIMSLRPESTRTCASAGRRETIGPRSTRR